MDKNTLFLPKKEVERVTVVIKPAYDNKEEIRQLFLEYTNYVIAQDTSFAEYLKIQNYEEELEHLEMKYKRPQGSLYLAYVDGQPAGCIGMKRVDATRCEMKRLYVRPEFRGHQLAKKLVHKIMDDARETGYQVMLLDTLPFLKEAIGLYRQLGFKETECYNDSPMDTSIFLKRNL